MTRLFELSHRLIYILTLVAVISLVPGIRAADHDVKTLHPPRLLESLWQKLKHTMEMTTNALSSHKSPKVNEPDRTQDVRHSLSSRRITLVRKTLRDIFAQRFIKSFPTWDAAAYPQLDSSSASRHITGKPIRWKDEGTTAITCYFFSERVDAYWSFQWCPTGIVLQGFRTQDYRLDVRHVIGTFVSSYPTDPFVSSSQPVEVFAREYQLKYPDAQLELYHHGDPCTNGMSNQRMAVVLHHPETSKLCDRDWPDKSADRVIEGIEEPQDCKYAIHVCSLSLQAKSPITTPTANPTLVVEAQRVDQAMEKMQQSLQSYLKETTADTQRKIRPDRTTSLHVGLPPLPRSRIQSNLQLVKDMFQHAYDSYMYNAFPASEIKPMTCQAALFDLVRIPGLTLIDSLDTLVVLGNYTEFARAVERIRHLHLYLKKENSRLNGGGLFALNQNVSVFETNIRVLGGLLSAHQMAEAFLSGKVPQHEVWSKDGTEILSGITDIGNSQTKSSSPSNNDSQCSPDSVGDATRESGDGKDTICQNDTVNYWKYDGFLLELAQDIGDRLLPAFSTKTGIPYGTVNLLSGIPQGETTIASLAGGGTLSLEMELLSRLTGNPEYGKAAKLATRALWMRRSQLGLVGKHICTHRGEWTETLSGIGSNSDSFYEYLIKHYILFPEDDDFWPQFLSAYGGIFNESRSGEWYGDVDYHRGQSIGMSVRRVFESLMAFYPGMQVLLGELTPAARSLNSFFLVREYLGFLPERFNYAYWKVDAGGGEHFLRPELLESAYFMHRATKGFQHQFRNGTDDSFMDTSGWQWAADFALHALERSTKTVCGYASLRSVSPTTTGDIDNEDQPFSTRNLKNEMPSFFLSETLKYLYLTFDENNILHTDKDRDWVFTTEAHPIHNNDVLREDKVSKDMLDLKVRLVEKLRARSNGTKQPPSPTSNSYEHEKWTDATSSTEYFKQAGAIAFDFDRKAELHRLASETISHGPDFWETSQMVEPLLTIHQVSAELDFFRETQNKRNAAHITFRKLGMGWEITNSCPNFYLPDWRWVRALNGGATDYSDAYVSSAMDTPVAGESLFRMVGSLDAIGFHGSGIHVMELYDKGTTCPLVDQSGHATKGASNVNTEQEAQARESLNVGDDFEVTVFPEGRGFFIQHRTGEIIVATQIKDEASHHLGKTYVMVHGSTPHGIDDPAHESLSDAEIVQRSVAIADTDGNAFFCHVDVILREIPIDSAEDSDGHSEALIAQYPCAPALFGPARMSELILTGGMVIESKYIQGPHNNDAFGCQVRGNDRILREKSEACTAESWFMNKESNDYCNSQCEVYENNAPINLVYRGYCTFEEKALIQKNEYNAKAVIVINSEEDELFVMSGGSVGRAGLLDSSLPPAVLITGADGNDLAFLGESYETDDSSEMVVRISIVKDQARLSENNKVLSVHDNQFWPAIRTMPGTVQIFAKGGWGVHATQRNGDSTTDVDDWQLVLIPHDISQREKDDIYP